jgi:hypothetical protein
MQKSKLGNSNLEGPAIGLGRQISAGVSLCILALGFLVIGLVLLIHPSLSGDSLAAGAISCSLGGWAGLVIASVFLFAVFLYWRRSTLARSFMGLRFGLGPATDKKGRRSP